MGSREVDDSLDHLTLMLVPGGAGTIRRFHVRRRLVRQCIAAAIVVLAASLTLGVDYVRVRVSVSEIDALRVHASEQRDQIDAYAAQIEEISEALSRLRQFDHKLRVIADLDPSDALPLGGIGGIEGEGLDRHYLSGLTRGQRHARMMESLDRIGEVAGEQEKSLQELVTHLEGQHARLAHTPSVSPTKGWITSNFGHRVSPFTSKRELHRGIDIAGRIGTPILAPADGRVRYTGPNRGLGNSVILRHGYGVESIYGHLSDVLVEPGQAVKRGDKIALMGNTGRSTGPHLHYQVNVNGVAVNPRNYMLD